MRVVESFQNRAYSEKLSRVVHRGLITAVRAGKRSGGFAPYGYDLAYADHKGEDYARVRFVPVGMGARCVVVEGRRHRAFEKHVTYLADGRTEVLAPEHSFVPKTKPVRSTLVLGDSRAVEAVRFIFEAYLGGRGMRSIALELARRGYVGPEGNGWSVPSVRSILVNPEYAGSAVYGRRSESKYHRLEAGGAIRELDEGEVPVNRQLHIEDRERWVITEGAHEPIVSLAVWTAANERRQGRAKRRQSEGGRATARRPYLLSGFLGCPVCGRKYVGIRTKNTKGYLTPYYQCGTYARGGGCSRRAVREEDANRAILDLLSEILRTEVPADELRTAVRAALVGEGPVKEPPATLAIARVQLSLGA
jgi:hypothetical protein